MIDPGQAFGTGAHATTRLCLELMLGLEPAGSFLDIGCGSGVLAITAARLGWAPVLAGDYDRLAVRATRENAGVNGVSIETARIDLRTDPLPAARTVAANLLTPLLLDLARRLDGEQDRERPERVIASGVLKHEADAVARAFAAAGLIESQRRTAGEWSATAAGARPDRSWARFWRHAGVRAWTTAARRILATRRVTERRPWLILCITLRPGNPSRR